MRILHTGHVDVSLILKYTIYIYVYIYLYNVYFKINGCSHIKTYVISTTVNCQFGSDQNQISVMVM